MEKRSYLFAGLNDIERLQSGDITPRALRTKLNESINEAQQIKETRMLSQVLSVINLQRPSSSVNILTYIVKNLEKLPSLKQEPLNESELQGSRERSAATVIPRIR